MSVWNPENVKDVAESIGVTSLSDDVVQGLTSDIEFRISQVIEEALKFMRHGKRSVLSTQDITQSLRALGVEPLYGYESTRPLRFGEASIGPGQPLFYVEDEEVDFEKLINAPLPKIPRDISFTAHWLAVEGVQPSIPQNPTAAESRNQELVPRGSNANPNLAAMSGSDNVSVKPLVKHVLSQELQIFFEKVCSALLDESNNDYRVAALASVASDPGLHQLVPYFVQFIAEKVTHNLKNLFVLEQAMQLTHAMLDNKSLYIDPYIASLVPPILTCLIGRHLGTPISTSSLTTNTNSLTNSTIQNSTSSSMQAAPPHFALRRLSASLLATISKRYSSTSSALKPRLARTCLKAFLDPTKPLGTNYGGVVGLTAIGGAEVVRGLIVPNMKSYGDMVLKDILASATGTSDETKRREAEMMVEALMDALRVLERKDGKGFSLATANANGNGNGSLGTTTTNGVTAMDEDGDHNDENSASSGGLAGMREPLNEKIGAVLAGRVVESGNVRLARAVLDA